MIYKRITVAVGIAVFLFVLIGIGIFFARTTGKDALQQKAIDLYTVEEQGYKGLRGSVTISDVTPSFVNTVANPYIQYPAYAQAGQAYSELHLGVVLAVATPGKYKIRVIYQGTGNGLKTSLEKEQDLAVGTQTIPFALPSDKKTNSGLTVWLDKMPLGSAEVSIEKWTTEKEIVGVQLSQSEESKQPQFYGVTRKTFRLTQ